MSSLRIVCPSCSPTQIIPIEQPFTETRCPSCHKRLRAVTRHIKNVSTQHLDASQSRVTLTTQEPGGGIRHRAFIAPTSAQLKEGALITMVYNGERLVGIADQDTSLWYPFTARDTDLQRGRQRFLTFMALVVCVLAAAQIERLSRLFLNLLSSSEGILLLILGALFFCAPALLWSLETTIHSKKQGYLPVEHHTELD